MDPALKFVVDVQNSESIKRLTTDINQQKDQIAALNAQLRAGAISQQQFAAAAMPMGQSIAHASQQVTQLESASRNASRGLAQFAYAIDDVQYGFNAIVNNIPQIVMAMGAGAGVAGAVGIAAVAVNQLIIHWAQLTDALSSAWSGAAIDQLTAMREKAEAATKAFEDLAKAPTKAQAAQAKGVADLITEGPTEVNVQKVMAALEKHPSGPQMTDDEKAYLDRKNPKLHPGDAAARGPTDEEFFQAQQGVNARVKERRRAEAERILGEATLPGDQGKRGRQALGKLVPELQRDLDALTPEGQRKKAREKEEAGITKEAIDTQNKAAQDEAAKEFKIREEERQRGIDQKNLDLAGGRLGRKSEEKAKDKNDKLVDKLNEQGQENQRIGEERARKDRIEDLQDRRDKVMDEKQAINNRAFNERHEQRPGQILSGAKAVVDMYQKSAGGNSVEQNAKKSHALQEAANKKLDSIDKELKKEQRVRPT